MVEARDVYREAAARLRVSLRIAIAGLIDLLDALERDADREPDDDGEESPDKECDWPSATL